MGRSALLLMGVISLGTGCGVRPAHQDTLRSAPHWHAVAVGGHLETTNVPPNEVYAWDLRIAGGVARWRICKHVLVCGDTEREHPATELVAVQRVGRTQVRRGEEVDVLRLSLRAPPRMVRGIR